MFSPLEGDEEDGMGEEEEEYVSEEENEDGEEKEDVESEVEQSLEELNEEDIEYIDEEDLEYMDEKGDMDVIEEDKEDGSSSLNEVEGLLKDSSAEEAFPIEDNTSSQEIVDIDAGLEKPGETIPAPVKKWIPLKKIKTEAYSKAGFLVNAVYIARPEENLAAVSQKIFNSDQSAMLLAINPHLAKRDVKVGDKIYYQSPHRPQDSSRLLFYFEDIGASPEIYAAASGENIRVIASQLLGHSNSWKEIWASNLKVQSKGVLNQPVNLKYWTFVSTNPALEPEPPSEPEMLQEPTPEPEPEPLPPEQALPPEEQLPPEDSVNKKPSSPVLPINQGKNLNPVQKAIGKFLQKNVLAGLILVGVALVLVILIIKKRKQKSFDYTAANFEIDPENK